ncbi:EipA-like [Rhabdaerophilaceae bacterium]
MVGSGISSLRRNQANSKPRRSCGFLTLAMVVALLIAAFPFGAVAQQRTRPGDGSTFRPGEVVNAGHKFFGTISRGLALTVEEATRRWGEPNGYILGQEASGAFVGGLRYGEGTLYTRNAGDRKVYWQGPSVGFDFGGEGARTMMLVYKLPRVPEIYQRFVGIDGSAFFIGGFGMTALTANDILVVPIRSGVGARLGVNLGYLKFTDQATWNPF